MSERGAGADRLTRTYLAVPAHRERLVRSAAASAADAVFLDLEDAVPVAEKPAALAAAIAAVGALDWGAKTVAVRVNAADSGRDAEELAALAPVPRLDAVILPKAERAEDVTRAGAILAAAKGERAAPPELDLLIETALGLVRVDELAALPGIAALHLGVGDLAASLGARSPGIGVSPPGYRHRADAGMPDDAAGDVVTPLDLFAYPMMRLLLAARAYGLRAMDGPWGGFQDLRATEAAAAKAAAMGFDGKHVIHPTQIAPTRDAFVPTAAEQEQARRVIAAMEEAERDGRAAATLDGRMIDIASLRMVRRALRLAG